MTREQLLLDLYRAYKDARKHKRAKPYQQNFEYNLETNLCELCDELFERRYVPRPSTCFIIHDPKMREVFAADFRDRIVHHLFYNYTYSLYERTFIADSYSCIKGRGTHYGISRLRHHILSESRNYCRPCYVLKIDIKGYFMHINRAKLLKICRKPLKKDDFVDYLLKVIVETNPVERCIMIGDKKEWELLPSDKSLFSAEPGCGLPIGNLSSQLFSNIYMNAFDQYCKRVLKVKHYGRYVDDAFFVSSDRDFLKSIIPKIQQFLHDELGLDLNERKLQIYDVRYGVEFLGAFIKPFRTYVSSRCFRRIKRKVLNLQKSNSQYLRSSVNSFLGVLSHYDSYYLRKRFFIHEADLTSYGNFSEDCLKYNCKNL